MDGAETTTADQAAPEPKPASEAPRYRSFKVVRALKILHVSEIMCWPAEPGFAPIDLEPGWFQKHQPQAGGYYVMYEDGYASYSPAHPFETGYVLEPEQTGEQNQAEQGYTGSSDSVGGDNYREMRAAMIDKVAHICHEVNRAYCLSIGDSSQPHWSEAPDWQKSSARNGVEKILNGEIKAPEQSHESWMAEKVAAGWTFGPEKNPELKQHPCMVPYAELPAEQRVKDALFFAVCTSV